MGFPYLNASIKGIRRDTVLVNRGAELERKQLMVHMHFQYQVFRPRGFTWGYKLTYVRSSVCQIKFSPKWEAIPFPASLRFSLCSNDCLQIWQSHFQLADRDVAIGGGGV